MADHPFVSANDLFREAITAFQSAISAGIKIQEDSTQRFLSTFRDYGSPTAWQTNTQTMMREAMQFAQRNIEESVRLMDHSAQTALDLWRSAFQGWTAKAPEAQSDSGKAEIWKAALGALQSNTQAVFQANSRLLEAWGEFTRDVTHDWEGATKQPSA